MKLIRITLAAAMLMTIGAAAAAQEDRTGMATVVDRLHGSVTIRQQSGDHADGAVERYKAPVKLLENVHAGDKVKFSVTEANNTKTITKIEAQ